MAVREVWAQCQLARAAYGYMQEGMQLGQVDRIFSSIQAVLSHTANVSKMLRAPQNPPGRARIWYERIARWLYRLVGWRLSLTRRPSIGDLLSVPANAIVHRDGRQARNDIEHYDERLLRWLRDKGPRVSIMDFNVMPPQAVRFGGNFIVVRNLNPVNLEFTIAGRDLLLPPLAAELQQIQAAASSWIAQNVP